MRAFFRAAMVPLPFFFRLSALAMREEREAASGIDGCVGVDVERVGGAIALPCEVGDDGAGAHGVDPELVRFPDDDVGVAHGGGRGNSVADGVVEVEVGELGLGEQRYKPN